jgi:hypothetical protein
MNFERTLSCLGVYYWPCPAWRQGRHKVLHLSSSIGTATHNGCKWVQMDIACLPSDSNRVKMGINGYPRSRDPPHHDQA